MNEAGNLITDDLIKDGVRTGSGSDRLNIPKSVATAPGSDTPRLKQFLKPKDGNEH